HSQPPNNSREDCRSHRAHSPPASPKDRETTWRHFERQFVGWISSNPRFCCLRSDESLRYKLLRSASDRTLGNGRKRLCSLSRSCAYRISGRCQTPGFSAGYRPGVRFCASRTSRAPRAHGVGRRSSACYSGFANETRDVSRSNNTDADPPLALALLAETRLNV